MAPTFDEKVAHWVAILRGEARYGDVPEASPRDMAHAYHIEEIFDEVLEQVRADYLRDREDSTIDTLVSLVGFSPETTINATFALRPRRLVLVFSRQSKNRLDDIHAQIVGRHRLLKPSDIDQKYCNPSNPISIYQVIKEALADAHNLFGDERDTFNDYIDITGGKKVMSAAAALVAWQLDLNICYVDSRYDRELRLAWPGSERLVELGNPMTLFGEQERQVAVRLFNLGNHAAATKQFEILARRISKPAQARFDAALSRLYADWASFRFDRMSGVIQQLREDLIAGRSGLTPERIERLRIQLEFLSSLRDESGELARDGLLVCYLLLADHYASNERADFAALLYYRAIESCLQQRLATTYELDASAMCEDDLDDQVLARWREDFAHIHGAAPERITLPPRIGLMHAAVLLSALDDAMLRDAQLSKREALGHLRQITDARNRSILAHGHQPIDPKLLRELSYHSHTLARRLWSDIYPDKYLDKYLEQLRFITL